jgi:deoxyribonuclease IV
MPLLGAHTSISGGLDRALYRGNDSGCQVIQIFTRNTSSWTTGALTAARIDAYFRAREELSVEPVAVHDSYLINLASPRPHIRDKSFSALLDELERANTLRIPYLVMHPGSHVGGGENRGLKLISRSLKKVIDITSSLGVRILLETTAGQGTSLGCRFEHLSEILHRVDAPDRMGVCLDTCHVFAAGYDFRTVQSYRRLIRSFDQIIGLRNLRLFHMNDSKKDLASRVDRHEHIGLGFIGIEGLSFFLRDPLFKGHPFIIETPKGRDETGAEWDTVNLGRLRQLMEE